MNGEDVMKIKVYKERREHWKSDRRKREEKQKKEHWGEESEKYHFYSNQVSLGAFVESLIIICF